jgi:hypothetical protein
MENKAYIESQKVCPFTKTDKCVYDTQGKFTCKGYVNEGAQQKQTITKTVTDKNTQLFQRLLDEKFNWH